MKQSKRIVSKTTIFLLIFVILTALHGVVLFYLYQSQYNKNISLILKSQENMIEFEKSRIRIELHDVFQDLLFLQRVAEENLRYESVLDSPFEGNPVLYKFLSLLGDLTQRYDVIQIVSPGGDELYRLEFNQSGGSRIIPEDQLKKGNRDYYFQIVENDADSLFFSKTKLTEDQNSDLKPQEPAFSFGRALTNESGEIIAYIILEYRGSHILDSLGEYEILPEANFNSYLINSEGYILNSRNKKPEIKIPDHTHFAVSRELPDLWIQLQMEESGTFTLNDNLFIHRRIESEDVIPAGSGNYLGEEALDYRTFYLVFETPGQVLKSLSGNIVASLFVPFLVTQFIILLLSILVSKWINRLQRYQQKLLHFSSMDEMTGCMNRRTGRKILENYLSLSRRRNSSVTVVYLDLNKLKTVNDIHGHREGDHYILTMVDLIKEQLRSTDFFIRMGGDEFLLILPDCRKDEAVKIRKRVLVKEYKLNKADIYPYTLGMSWGILEINAEHIITVPQILAQTDELMYLEKNNYPEVDENLLQEVEQYYSEYTAESSYH